MSVQEFCQKWASAIEREEGIDVKEVAELAEELGGDPELVRRMNVNQNGIGGGNAICLYVLLLIEAKRAPLEQRS